MARESQPLVAPTWTVDLEEVRRQAPTTEDEAKNPTTAINIADPFIVFYASGYRIKGGSR